MNTTGRSTLSDDDDGGGYGEKLIPEWRVSADDQTLLAGLAVVAAMLLAFGWSTWRGGDGDIVPQVVAVDDVDESEDAVAPVSTTVTTAAPTTTTTEAPTTTSTTAAPAPVIGDVQASVDPFPGDITGTNEGATAILTGFVANQGESDEAEAAAAAVEGIESVDNRLELLEPAVLSALQDQGVTGASATGVGTELTVAGTIDSEDVRQPTLDAAAAVPGVTNVIDDELMVSVTADLNALPQVQFATGSATILDESFADLDAAAELLISAGDDVRIEVQGYTDIRGDEAANLQLSDDRANAVREYLVGAGVNGEVLTSVGYGETEEFGAGESDEALRANRLVRFQQIG